MEVPGSSPGRRTSGVLQFNTGNPLPRPGLNSLVVAVTSTIHGSVVAECRYPEMSKLLHKIH